MSQPDTTTIAGAKLATYALGAVFGLGVVHATAYFIRVAHFAEFDNSSPKYLPQEAPDSNKRAKGVLAMKKEYNWHYDITGVPPNVREIPYHEFSAKSQDHHMNFTARVLKASAAFNFNRTVDNLTNLVKRTDPFDRFESYFSSATVKPPAAIWSWRTDEYFASQRLMGINPILIQRINKIPSKIPLQPETVLDVTGHSLQSLLDEGRVFMCDYYMLDRVRHRIPVERRMYAPIVLYYSHPHTNKLLPLAIQLSQEPGPDFPIFTPKDPKGIWLLVKMHCQVADANLHEVGYHLMPTHIMMEAVYVSMVRNLSTEHPIHTWMRQHFFYTVNLNWAARELLIGPEGAVPKLMMGYEATVLLLQETAKEFSYEKLNIPEQIKLRGVEDKNVLPSYHWREDAMEYWNMTYEFAKKMVDYIYRGQDALLGADAEVQNWITELTHQRGPAGCGIKGIPLDAEGRMTSLKDFTLFLTLTITNASIGHAAVNNPQYDCMAFIPNCPFTLKLGAPVTKEWDIDEEEIAKEMIGDADLKAAVIFVNMLCMPPEVDVKPDVFGSYEGEFFERPPVKEYVDVLQSKLRHLAELIDKRQEYRYLHPKRVSQGADS